MEGGKTEERQARERRERQINKEKRSPDTESTVYC